MGVRGCSNCVLSEYSYGGAGVQYLRVVRVIILQYANHPKRSSESSGGGTSGCRLKCSRQ